MLGGDKLRSYDDTMKRSPLFLGILTLAAILLLMVYGISAIAPLFEVKEEEPKAEQPQIATPTIDFGNPSFGPSNADLTIVVYGDYQCPSCAGFDATLVKVLSDFPNVRLVWKDIPNTSRYAESRDAAIAGRCAKEQGAFWEYHDILMANRDSLTETNYPIFAMQLGLDSEQFLSCLQDRTPDALIQRDIDEAIAIGVNASPYVFIGNQPYAGSMPEERLRTIIESELDRLGTP